MLRMVLKQALLTMRLHRLWAGLTMFGIVWGTASVVLLFGWGVGVHGLVNRGLEKVGKDLMFVQAGRIGDDLSPADQRRALSFELEDVDAVRAHARRLDLASAEMRQWFQVRRGTRGKNYDVRGIEAPMFALRGVRLAAGRALSPDDVQFGRRVAVLGSKGRAELFADGAAVGSRIDVQGQTFRVVGVLEPVGAQLARDGPLIDEQIWIPITTARTIMRDDSVRVIVVRPTDRRYNEDLKRELRRVLTARLHVSPTDEEAVFIFSMIDTIAGFDRVFRALRVFLVVLATTTLLIGGIGVMNMMLVAVRERRAEIGLRRALGARRHHVVGQFLAETLVVTLVGGALGLAFGIGCSGLLGLLPGDTVPVPVLVPRIIVLAITVTTLVGVVSGSVPAWRAAGVDPAETLRSRGC